MKYRVRIVAPVLSSDHFIANGPSNELLTRFVSEARTFRFKDNAERAAGRLQRLLKKLRVEAEIITEEVRP